MNHSLISLEGDHQAIAELHTLLTDKDISKSEPVQKDSLADPLDAPVGADDIQNIIGLITLVLKSSTAVIGFIAAIRKLFENKPKEQLVVRDPKSGEKKGVITRDSTDPEIEKFLS
jgi:hypothetical protein